MGADLKEDQIDAGDESKVCHTHELVFRLLVC